MNRVNTTIPGRHPPRPFDFWLFSDIDGTFLGGNPEHQSALRACLTAPGRRVGLVYCSGRSLLHVLPDIQTGVLLPPDAIIGDVGTGLWDARGAPLCTATHAWIDARWRDGTRRVQEALVGIRGITPQIGTGPRRASFFYEEPGAAARATRAIAPLGYDTLISGGRYLDVLPRGVNKGFAVRRVMELWSLQPDQVMTAGDTLNDLSMLRLPVHAVAVGNADAELRAGLRDAAHVRHATAAGAGGILEAMHDLRWVD
jgi:sucrose-6-phosphatase